MITQYLSDKIRGLSFLMSLLVVAIHCDALDHDWFNLAVGFSGIDRIWAGVDVLLSETVSWCAVPFFFVVSGFFMFKDYRLSLAWWKILMTRRCSTLLVPYLTWNVVYYVMKVSIGKYPWPTDADGAFRAIGLMLGYPLNGELACGQFWYIRSLLMYVILAPLFGLLLRNFVLSCCALALLTLLLLSGFQNLGYQFLNVGSLLYFSTGVILALHMKRLNETRIASVRSHICWLAPVVLGACAFIKVMGTVMRDRVAYESVGRLMTISGLLTVWFLYERLFARWLLKLRGLWDLSFFIYAVQCIVISAAVRISWILWGKSERMRCGYLLVLILSEFGVVIVSFALKRYASPLYRFLVGGR